VTEPADAEQRSPAGTARAAGVLRLGEDGHEEGASVRKLATGIRGFDHVAMGGLPARRATVVAGQAGSAKTVFAAQFLAEGVRRGQPGVFVTLEEPAEDLRANLLTLGCDLTAWEEAGDWRFVDASPLARADAPQGHAPYSARPWPRRSVTPSTPPARAAGARQPQRRPVACRRTSSRRGSCCARSSPTCAAWA
jgi:circadian clock protein KaiC